MEEESWIEHSHRSSQPSSPTSTTSAAAPWVALHTAVYSSLASSEKPEDFYVSLFARLKDASRPPPPSPVTLVPDTQNLEEPNELPEAKLTVPEEKLTVPEENQHEEHTVPEQQHTVPEENQHVPANEHPVPAAEHPVPVPEHVPAKEHPVPAAEHPVPVVEKTDAPDDQHEDQQDQPATSPVRHPRQACHQPIIEEPDDQPEQTDTSPATQNPNYDTLISACHVTHPETENLMDLPNDTASPMVFRLINRIKVPKEGVSRDSIFAALVGRFTREEVDESIDNLKCMHWMIDCADNGVDEEHEHYLIKEEYLTPVRVSPVRAREQTTKSTHAASTNKKNQKKQKQQKQKR